jgi:hypothetical protein
MSNKILAGNTGADQTRADFFYKPNMQLLNQALATKQKTYDDTLSGLKKIKARVDEVHTLGTHDTERHKQKALDYEGKIKDLQKLYGGDLSKAQGEFNDLLDVVAKDFGIHGEMTALESRYQGYMANSKDITDRRKKGEITKEQAWLLQRRLDKTDKIGIGDNPDQWIGWSSVNPTDAVDQAKFLKDFTEGWKADAVEKWGQPVRKNGILTWEKNGKKWADENEIAKAAKQALLNEMKKTGELDASWLYNKEVVRPDQFTSEGLQNSYDTTVENTNTKLKGIQEKMDNLGTLSGKPLQEAINSIFKEKGYAAPLTVDGKVGPRTKEALAQLNKSLEYDISNTKQELSTLEDGDPEAIVESQLYENWSSKLLEQAIRPWAQKEGFTEITHDLKTMKDPLAQWAHEKNMAKLNYTYQTKLEDYKWQKENENVHFQRATSGQTVVGKYGKDGKEYKERLAGLTARGGRNKENFIEALALNSGLTGPDKEKLIATLGKKVSNSDIANGRISVVNGRTILTKKGGEVIDFGKVQVDIGQLEKIQREAQHTERDIATAKRVGQEVKDDVLSSLAFDDKQKDYINNKEKIESDADAVFTRRYEKYVAKAKKEQEKFDKYATPFDKTIGSFMRPTVMSKDDWIKSQKPEDGGRVYTHFELRNARELMEAKDRLANTTDPKEAAEIQQEIKDLNDIGNYYKVRKDNEDTDRQFTNAFDEELGTRKFKHVSGKASTAGFIADGKHHMLDKRMKVTQEYFDEPANFHNTVFNFETPDGRPVAMTPNQYILEHLAGGDPAEAAKYKATVGRVLPTVGKPSFTMPVSFYKEDQFLPHASGDIEADFGQFETDFVKDIQEDPNWQLTQQVLENVENQIGESLPHTISDSFGNEWNYSVTTGGDLGNPNIHHHVNNSTFPIDGFAYQWDGQSLVTETITNPDGSTVEVPKTTRVSKTYDNDKGRKIIANKMEQDRITKRMNRAGIGSDRVVTIYVNPDGKGMRPVKKLLSLELMKIDKLGKNLSPNKIHEYATQLQVTPDAMMRMFGTAHNKTSYRSSKTPPHSDQAAQYNTEYIQYK